MEDHISSFLNFPPLVRYPPDILQSFTSIINDEALEEIREDFEISHPVHLNIPSEEFNIPEEIIEEIQSDPISDDESEQSIQISASKDPWTCGICNELYLDPVESICCHELFCEKCVLNVTKCPKCKSNTKWVSNIPVRKIMEEMVVKCRHALCELSFKRSALIKHENICELALIQCKNSPGCSKICRKDLDLHYSDTCEYRPVDCSSLCGKTLA